MSRTRLFPVLALGLALGLAGCSASAPTAPATARDAPECATIRPAVDHSLGLIETGMQAVGTDDDAVTTNLNSAATSIEEAVAPLGNSDVAHTARTFAQGVSQYRDAILALLKRPEVATEETFSALTTTLLGSADGFLTMCPVPAPATTPVPTP